MTLTGGAALALAGAGIVAGLLTLATTRRFGLALAVSLDLWTAVGLLLLSADGSWRAIAAAAAVVAIRKVAGSVSTTALPRSPAR